MPLCRFALTILILFSAAQASGQLASRSPFLPSEAEVAATAPAPALEFSGHIELAGGPQFRVIDPTRKTSSWVRLNQPDAELGLVAKRYDAEGDLLFVEQQGRTLTLPLKQSKIRNTSMTSAALPNLTVPNIDRGLRPSAGAAMTEAQKQLEVLAAAVAQRRAARAQPVDATVSPSSAPSPPAAARKL
jgi:hypothetical protein